MAQVTDIEQRVRSHILSEFLPQEDHAQFTNTTPLISSGVLDSLASLKLVGFLEKEFSIQLEAHEVDAENFDTIEKLARKCMLSAPAVKPAAA